MTASRPAIRWFRLLAIVPPPVVTTVALVLMVILDRVAPGPLLTPWPIGIAGLLLMAVGLVLALSAGFVFLRSGVSPRPFETGPTLIAHGPFRLSRNPMYLSLVLTLSGIAILLGHLMPWAGPILLFLWLDRLFLPHEEALLADHFKDSWETYRTRVRRWI